MTQGSRKWRDNIATTKPCEHIFLFLTRNPEEGQRAYLVNCARDAKQIPVYLRSLDYVLS